MVSRFLGGALLSATLLTGAGVVLAQGGPSSSPASPSAISSQTQQNPLIPDDKRVSDTATVLVTSGADTRPLQPDQATLSGAGAADLVGVPMSDLVRFYIDHVDKTSDIVVCPELVQDKRPVTLRSSSLRTPQAIEQALRGVGYEIQARGRVKYICLVPEQGYRDPDAASDQPLTIALDSPEPIVVQRKSPIDDLVSSGALFVGCTRDPSGKKVVVFSKTGYGTMTFSRAEFAKSEASAFYECRS